MQDNRLVLGVYLKPHVWLCQENEVVDPKTITPQECLQIVFSKKLPNGIEVCAQRQGFVVAAIPEELLSISVSELNAANLLPMNAARFALDFFNAFLYLIYDQLQRSNTHYSVKQTIGIADIWVWLNRGDVDLSITAIQQPMLILDQNNFVTPDTVLQSMGKTIGWLSENDKLFRPSCNPGVLDGAFDAMFLEKDYLLNWQLIALLNKAISSTQRGEFADAHILSWAVIEKLVQIEWHNFLESTSQTLEHGAKTMNSRRKQTLKSANYSVSSRIEMLELARVISYDLYSRLDAVRKVRNDWIHNLVPVNLQDCRACYLAARDLLSRKIGFSILHPGGYYFQVEDLPIPSTLSD